MKQICQIILCKINHHLSSRIYLKTIKINHKYLMKHQINRMVNLKMIVKPIVRVYHKAYH